MAFPRVTSIVVFAVIFQCDGLSNTVYLLLTGNVELSSSVIEGRQFTCPGELVTFTCQVFGSISLKWQFRFGASITYTTTNTPPDVITLSSFEANLTSISMGDIATNSNITSTLRMTEPMDAVSVQCLSTQDNETEAFKETGYQVVTSIFCIMIWRNFILTLNLPEHRISH